MLPRRFKPSKAIKPLPNNQIAPGTGTAAILPGLTTHAMGAGWRGSESLMMKPL